eukprot:m.228766 g.228766  ORF g.228766 m.228766 type:complete len:255 (-) comp11786_c0_seq1:33-797(-)
MLRASCLRCGLSAFRTGPGSTSAIVQRGFLRRAFSASTTSGSSKSKVAVFVACTTAASVPTAFLAVSDSATDIGTVAGEVLSNFVSSALGGLITDAVLGGVGTAVAEGAAVAATVTGEAAATAAATTTVATAATGTAVGEAAAAAAATAGTSILAILGSAVVVAGVVTLAWYYWPSATPPQVSAPTVPARRAPAPPIVPKPESREIDLKFILENVLPGVRQLISSVFGSSVIFVFHKKQLFQVNSWKNTFSFLR